MPFRVGVQAFASNVATARVAFLRRFEPLFLEESGDPSEVGRDRHHGDYELVCCQTANAAICCMRQAFPVVSENRIPALHKIPVARVEGVPFWRPVPEQLLVFDCVKQVDADRFLRRANLGQRLRDVRFQDFL